MIDPTLCYLVPPEKVAKLPLGCPVECDTVINVREVDGMRTAEPWTPGRYFFSGVFLRVGYIRVGPVGKRKALNVVRIYEALHRRIITVPLDGIRVRQEAAINHAQAVAALVGYTVRIP